MLLSEIAEDVPFASTVLLQRDRIHRFVDEVGTGRLLFICAPAGSGKTVLAHQHVSLSGGQAAIISASATMSLASMKDALARSAAIATVIIDDADRLPLDVREWLVPSCLSAASRQNFVLTCRRPGELRMHAAVARGAGGLLDAAMLAFDCADVRELAARVGLTLDDETAAQIVHYTDGWALAIEWILREGALMRRHPRVAYEAWHAAHGWLFLEHINDAYGASGAAFAEFTAALAEPSIPFERLVAFESLGFPLVRSRGMVRPNRLMTALRAEAPILDRRLTQRAPSAHPVLFVRALGRFRCSIGESEVHFQRRRDQNVFFYIALADDMRVDREKLLAAFWPTANRTLATQGLRTTLSRIRRALATIVGRENVDRYFESAGDVQLAAGLVSVDVRRFVEHVRLGERDDERGMLSAALGHYTEAERLYRGRLLASECVEPVFEVHVRDIETMFERTLKRLVHLLFLDEPAKSESFATMLISRTANARPEQTTFLGTLEGAATP